MAREIPAQQITDQVEKLFLQCNYVIGQDIRCAFDRALACERSPVGCQVLHQLVENSEIAAREEVPLCQDTGMAILFIRHGQEVRILGGDFSEAVQELSLIHI